ncbi:MAG: precorrin-4/cobalt-precorrin-4 C11-methyltransferase [Solirubrobacteraceae bacterium]|jgi:precorrin-4/cobalt-precorrin-4 C11-methyltransferase|nr:precorrin-4/cobalt-precorrin-4 C11-methyltransferase [Solirubrobacteraceae bacterium]
MLQDRGSGGGKVFLIGGGPGAADLVTLRGARAIARSDIVIWGRPLVTEELVREHSRPDAEIIAWPPATMADLEAAYDRAAQERLTIARLHGGDPAVYARLAEEIERVASRGLEVEVIPGVTAACAAAAALGWELTSEADRRPLVMASAQAPDGGVADMLQRGASGGHALAVYMLRSSGAELQQALLEGGYPPGTACAIGNRVSWPGEVLDRCSLEELGERLQDLGVEGSTVVLIAATAATGV